MSTDNNVKRSICQTLHDCFLLCGTAETRQHIYIHSVFGKPLPETVKVLLRQYRSRRKNRHLITGIDHPERRNHCHLGLAKTDIPAQKPVHRVFTIEIRFDLGNGTLLIHRQLKIYPVLKCQLLIILRRQRQIRSIITHRLHTQQIRRIFTH